VSFLFLKIKNKYINNDNGLVCFAHVEGRFIDEKNLPTEEASQKKGTWL
jgi:hypothetical protein